MLPEITSLIDDGLEVVERNLSQHLLFLKLDERLLQPRAGALRLRAALHLLSANLCGYAGDSSVQVATIVELMHIASGVHHGVVQQDGNGKAALNPEQTRWIDILRGDWLWMQAFRLATSERNFQILEILTAAAKNVVEGEMLQICSAECTTDKGCIRTDAAARKTAYLTGACMQLGGVLAGKKASEQRRLFLCGFYLGLAWIVAHESADVERSEFSNSLTSDLPSKWWVPVALRNGGVPLVPRKVLLQAEGVDAPHGSCEIARVIGMKGYRYVQCYPDSPFRRCLYSISVQMSSPGSYLHQYLPAC
jgi:geranylgeranyl pyrophosphate synthase